MMTNIPELGYANFISNFSFFSVPFKPSKFYFVRQFLREGLQRSNYQLGASSLFSCPTLSVVFLAEECFPGLLRGMPTHKIASRDKNKFQPFFSFLSFVVAFPSTANLSVKFFYFRFSLRSIERVFY